MQAGRSQMCGGSMEVFGQFSGLLSQAALEALLADKRKLQGCVPDFLLQGQVQGLAELKLIGSCPSHYPRKTLGVRPVDKRAGAIQSDYEKKLRDHDPSGRAVTRLREFGPVRGLVVGAYGEFSADLHTLVRELVEAKIPGVPEHHQGCTQQDVPLGTDATGGGSGEAAGRRHHRRVVLMWSGWC